MPALVLTPKETVSQFHRQKMIMHDPKLTSGFPMMPQPAPAQAALRNPAMASSSSSSSSLLSSSYHERGLDKNLLDKTHAANTGLHNHHHHHHPHPHHNSLHHHNHHHHHHQQHPYYGRSLSHPLTNHHHFSNPHPPPPPRVPPLHPLFPEEIMLNFGGGGCNNSSNGNRSGNSFLSMISALKAQGYGRNLVDYFRPHAFNGSSSGNNVNVNMISPGGHFELPSSCSQAVTFHSEGLHDSVLSSSLPTQISTLYQRMMSQSSRAAHDYRIPLELSRLSSSNPDARMIPLLPSSPPTPPPQPAAAAVQEAGLSLEKSPFLLSLSLPSAKDSKMLSSLNCQRFRSKDRLSLSMSPLRLSETSTTSSLSSPSLSLSPSSSHSSCPLRGSTPSPESKTMEPSSSSSLAVLERKSNPLFSVASRPEISTRSVRDAASMTSTDRPLLPMDWQMAGSPKDNMFSATAPPQMVLSVPQFLRTDTVHPSNPLVDRVCEYSIDLYLHHHQQQQHHHHRRDLLGGDSVATDALLRPSSPEDYNSKLHRSSPGKELPTKLSKQTRLRERQEVTSALDADREKSDRLSAIRKSASTQTQFSSFPHETPVGVPPPPPYFTTHDTILRDGTTTSTIAPHHPYHPHNHHHQHHHLQDSHHLNGHHHHHNLPPPPPFCQSSMTSTSSSSHLLSASSLPSSSLSSSTSSSSLSYSHLTNGSRVSLLSPGTPNTTNNSNNYLTQSKRASSLASKTPTPPSSTTFLSLTTPTTPSSLPLNSHESTTSAIAIPPPLPSCPNPSNKTLPPIYARNGTTPPPPPPPQYKDVTRLREVGGDMQDTPLNLSKTNEGTTLVVDSNICSNNTSHVTKHKKTWIQRNGSSQETDPEDDPIEEHFRRSLGQKYVDTSSISSSSSSSTPKAKILVDASSMTTNETSSLDSATANTPTAANTPAAVDAEGVHITGSVDDHFARALGDQMWTAIKARSEPPSPEASPGTVDAHFAKALGATMWKKLQADADVIEPATNHNHQQQQQQQQYHNSPNHPPASVSPNRPQLAM